MTGQRPRTRAQPDSWTSGDTAGVFRYFFRAYRGRSTLMVLLMVGAGLAEGVGVLALIPVLEFADSTPASGEGLGDAVTAGMQAVGLSPTLVTLLGLIVVTIIVKSVLLFFAQRQVGYTVAAVVRDFRLELIRSLLEARWSYFLRKPPGEFANAIGSEARRSALAYQEACASIAALCQMAVYAAIAFMLSWLVALGAVVTGTLVGLAGTPFFALTRSSGRRWTGSSRQLASRLVDALQGVKALKAMGKEGLVWPLLEHETESLNQARRQEVVAAQALRSLQEPVLTLVLAAGLYFLLELSDLALSEALVMAFVFYRVVGHVHTLQHRYQGILSGESAFHSFRAELAAARANREEWPGSEPHEGLRRELRLVDVHYGYDDKPVLRGIEAVFPARSLLAIHGESGSGKTTLCDLLAGLLRPTAGEILVDGISLEQLDLGAWRQRLGYVPQEPLLFNGTILENVTLGDASYTRSDAQAALTLAGAWEFVGKRDEGLDAPIGERGAMLSGGQRQRIALARALVGSPALLLLDEVTTGLDPATEARIIETLAALSRSVTIVSISHHGSLSEVADHVFVMKDGRLEPLSREDRATG